MRVLTAAEPMEIAALRERDEFFWLDLECPSTDDLRALSTALDLHPLALGDTINFGQRPKIDELGDHLLMVFYSVTAAEPASGRQHEPLEVHVHVSGAFVVTVRRRPCPALDAARERIRAQPPVGELTLIYSIVRALCDAYDEPLAELERRVDEQEDAVFTGRGSASLEVIYRLHQEVRDLGRRMTTQRDQLRYAGDQLAAIPNLSPGPRPELRSLADQVAEIASELDRHDADIGALVNAYFSATANDTNALATSLARIATFFLVWTLVTGFFGQNFGWLTDNITTRWDFLVFGVGSLVVGTLIAVALASAARGRRG